MPKQYQNVDEILADLYAMQSYFKNHVAFDAESEVLDRLRVSLYHKADRIKPEEAAKHGR